MLPFCCPLLKFLSLSQVLLPIFTVKRVSVQVSVDAIVGGQVEHVGMIRMIGPIGGQIDNFRHWLASTAS